MTERAATGPTMTGVKKMFEPFLHGLVTAIISLWTLLGGFLG